MPRGESKHRYWFFADTPNIAWTVSVFWKDLLWRADLYRLIKYRGGCQWSVWCEKCLAARHFSVIGKQLLQIIETGFAEQFYASHRMGPAPISLKISARIAERETYRMILLKIRRLFSHWSIPLRSTDRPEQGPSMVLQFSSNPLI